MKGSLCSLFVSKINANTCRLRSVISFVWWVCSISSAIAAFPLITESDHRNLPREASEFRNWKCSDTATSCRTRVRTLCAHENSTSDCSTRISRLDIYQALQVTQSDLMLYSSNVSLMSHYKSFSPLPLDHRRFNLFILPHIKIYLEIHLSSKKIHASYYSLQFSEDGSV